jgi:hypothetical protein
MTELVRNAPIKIEAILFRLGEPDLIGFILRVGKTGFEPATPWSQTRCATGLRYFPIPFFKGVAKIKINSFTKVFILLFIE